MDEDHDGQRFSDPSGSVHVQLQAVRFADDDARGVLRAPGILVHSLEDPRPRGRRQRRLEILKKYVNFIVGKFQTIENNVQELCEALIS